MAAYMEFLVTIQVCAYSGIQLLFGQVVRVPGISADQFTFIVRFHAWL